MRAMSLVNALRAVLMLACLLASRGALALPPGFTQTDIGGDWAQWDYPPGSEVEGLAFSSDGTRLYVVARGGKVWLVENGVRRSTPFLDVSDEVGGWRDFCLLGFAVHANVGEQGSFDELP